MKMLVSLLAVACAGCSHLVSDGFDTSGNLVQPESPQLEKPASPDAAGADHSLPAAVGADSNHQSKDCQSDDLLKLFEGVEKLKPLHRVPGQPDPGDWLSQHDEPGQTFREYLQTNAVTPTGQRTVIYVQPLGDFSEKQRQIIELTAEYLGIYFDRPVEILTDLPLSIIPEHARRRHPKLDVEQILTTHVLNSVLRPRLPPDAAAYIAFTATDLWPGRGWSFVFGQASIRHRVGVWSINRNGDPSTDNAAYLLCLRRTLKTATHETGHIFSIRHCTAYECNMCGSNHREESDRYPLYLCPECHAKVLWATGADATTRYRNLADYCLRVGLESEHSYFTDAIATLSE